MTIEKAIKTFPNDADLGDFIRYNFSSIDQIEAYTTFVKGMKVYPEKHAIVYPALGLAGESGEIAEKVKKWLRGDRELDKDLLKKELGDVLWYITSMADDLGSSLSEIINLNIEKLSSRKERGVVKGDGDTR